MIAYSLSTDPSSNDLQRRVGLFLQIHGITRESAVSVRADFGVVTLTGQVRSHRQRQTLTAFTRRVAGVQRVVNRLEVAGRTAVSDYESGQHPVFAS